MHSEFSSVVQQAERYRFLCVTILYRDGVESPLLQNKVHQVKFGQISPHFYRFQLTIRQVDSHHHTPLSLADLNVQDFLLLVLSDEILHLVQSH